MIKLLFAATILYRYKYQLCRQSLLNSIFQLQVFYILSFKLSSQFTIFNFITLFDTRFQASTTQIPFKQQLKSVFLIH